MCNPNSVYLVRIEAFAIYLSNVKYYNEIVIARIYKSIPAQLGVLKLPLHCFHLYHKYLEHHDYHKYIQSHLCPT